MLKECDSVCFSLQNCYISLKYCYEVDYFRKSENHSENEDGFYRQRSPPSIRYFIVFNGFKNHFLAQNPCFAANRLITLVNSPFDGRFHYASTSVGMLLCNESGIITLICPKKS